MLVEFQLLVLSPVVMVVFPGPRRRPAGRPAVILAPLIICFSIVKRLSDLITTVHIKVLEAYWLCFTVTSHVPVFFVGHIALQAILCSLYTDVK